MQILLYDIDYVYWKELENYYTNFYQQYKQLYTMEEMFKYNMNYFASHGVKISSTAAGIMKPCQRPGHSLYFLITGPSPQLSRQHSPLPVQALSSTVISLIVPPLTFQAAGGISPGHRTIAARTPCKPACRKVTPPL